MAQLSVVQNLSSALAHDGLNQIMSRTVNGVSVQKGDIVVVTATSGGTEVYFSGVSGGGLTFTERHAGTHTSENPSAWSNVVFYTATATSTQTFNLTTSIGRWVQEIPWGFQVSVIRNARGIGAVGGVRSGTTGLVSTATQQAGSVIYYGVNDWNATNLSGRNMTTAANGTTWFESYYGFVSGFDAAAAGYYYFNTAAGTKSYGMQPFAGSKNSAATLEILEDKPPSQVTGVTTTALSMSSIRLNWTAATDDVGVASYTIRRNGVVVATNITTLTWTDTGLAGGTTYAYTVAAVDTLPQEGAQSASTNGTTVSSTITGSPMALDGSGALSIAVGSSGGGTPASAISFVDSTKYTYDVDIAGNPGPTANWTIPVPTSGGPLAANDVIVVHYSLDTPNTTTPVRTLPSGWLSLIGGIRSSGSGTTVIQGEAIYHVVTAGEAGTTPTWTLALDSALEGSLSVARFRGVDPADPIAVPDPGYSWVGQTGSTTHTAPAVTTDADNAYLITGISIRNGSVELTSGPSGYTVAAETFGDLGRSSAVAYKAQPVAGASTTAVWTHTGTSIQGFSWQSALKPAPGTPGGSTPAVTVNAAPLSLAGSGSMVLSGGKYGARGSVDLTGSGSLGLVLTGVGHTGSVPLSGSGIVALAVQRVTVDQAVTGLSGGSSLGLQATRIVVPKTGSITVPPFTGGSTLDLDGHPHLVEYVPIQRTGAGQLVTVPLKVAGGGRVDFYSTGLLKIKDPWSKPIYVMTDIGVWREADLLVWNGRAWLNVPLAKFHLY